MHGILIRFISNVSIITAVPRINPTGVRGKGNAPDNMVITWNQVEPLKYSGQGFGYEVR